MSGRPGTFVNVTSVLCSQLGVAGAKVALPLAPIHPRAWNSDSAKFGLKEF